MKTGIGRSCIEIGSDRGPIEAVVGTSFPLVGECTASTGRVNAKVIGCSRIACPGIETCRLTNNRDGRTRLGVGKIRN